MLVAACLQEIADKYPPWLEKQAAAGSSSTLSPADMERYRRQYDCIKRLCAAYESDPGDTANIMGLLQEVGGHWWWCSCCPANSTPLQV